MKVYFISGLGADERIFNFLKLNFCEPVFIKWIDPLPKESLPSYAKRLSVLIEEPDPVIVGLSFGGMIATEIAKANPAAKAIIISSAKTYKEVPAYFRMFEKFPVHNWSSHKLSKTVSRPIAKLLLGAKGEANNAVINELLDDVNMDFDVWAVDAILKWRNMTIPPNLVHIHGRKDILLPYKYTRPNVTIQDGTHSMIMNNADELSAWLKDYITQIKKES